MLFTARHRKMVIHIRILRIKITDKIRKEQFKAFALVSDGPLCTAHTSVTQPSLAYRQALLSSELTHRFMSLLTSIQAQALWELCILQLCSHPHVAQLREAYRGVRTGHTYVVLELTDRPLTRELLHHPRGLPEDRVKLIAYQLLAALDHLHRQQVHHATLPEKVFFCTCQAKAVMQQSAF